MMRKLRISIAMLMGVVLIAAIGFAAVRNASVNWAGVMLMLTCGVLMLGVVGAVCRGPRERAWWLGFTLFGGGYLAHAMAISRTPLPTITLTELIGSGLSAKLSFSIFDGRDGWNSLVPGSRILHCLWALALALLGAILAGLLVAGPAVTASRSTEGIHAVQLLSTARWKRPALIGLAGFWIMALAATVGRWPAPGIWAGVSFLLTCGLLGLAGLAAAFSRSRHREVWLGAALFGFGYLALAFDKSQLLNDAPHLPTEGLINRLLRADGPPIQSHFPDFTTIPGFMTVKNQIIMRKLDQPISLHFPKATPLEEVLAHIRHATADVNFPGIPIYVDPVGLRNAEQSMTSTVQNIDFDAIPVTDALRMCLMQLDLGFSVRQGFVMISDGDSATIPVYEDPVQVVGHSLFALIAAGVGAAAARFVSDRTRGLEQVDGATVTERNPL
jgi:hypothetical protein